MLDRYSTEEMRALWSPVNKTQRWLDVEIAVCDGLERFGRIPAGTTASIQRGARFDLDRMAELEKETRHDVMAFVRNVSENLGPEGRFVHYGVTSYDIVDTALATLLRDAATQLILRAGQLLGTLKRRAWEYRDTVTIGRTHGIHAEPITFGFKLATWVDELSRSISRLEAARIAVSVGKISGAVGTHANIDPEIEAYVCKALGLAPAPISTQVIARDRIGELMCAMALMASSLERFATEVRNLARTEIREVQEYFAEGQKGSSAMPHKRNPWNSETVTGLARIVRANLQPALEDMATWHERDLTNSSVERVILPDTTTLLDWMLAKFDDIVTRLVVFPERMAANLAMMGELVYSEQVMLALVGAGMSREDAYGVAQRAASRAWAGESFRAVVEADDSVHRFLEAGQIAACFDLSHHLKNVRHSFDALQIGPPCNEAGGTC